jgi:hypothetical protein
MHPSEVSDPAVTIPPDAFSFTPTDWINSWKIDVSIKDGLDLGDFQAAGITDELGVNLAATKTYDLATGPFRHGGR